MVFSAATVGAPRCPTTGTREQAVARSPAPVVAAGTTSEEIGRAAASASSEVRSTVPVRPMRPVMTRQGLPGPGTGGQSDERVSADGALTPACTPTAGRRAARSRQPAGRLRQPMVAAYEVCAAKP
ncbi:hypothetical protein GCM10020229_32140 [Kitasatospora albolonga]